MFNIFTESGIWKLGGIKMYPCLVGYARNNDEFGLQQHFLGIEFNVNRTKLAIFVYIKPEHVHRLELFMAAQYVIDLFNNMRFYGSKVLAWFRQI